MANNIIDEIQEILGKAPEAPTPAPTAQHQKEEEELVINYPILKNIEPTPFDADYQAKTLKLDDLQAEISAIFNQLFIDYDGCKIEYTPNLCVNKDCNMGNTYNMIIRFKFDDTPADEKTFKGIESKSEYIKRRTMETKKSPSALFLQAHSSRKQDDFNFGGNDNVANLTPAAKKFFEQFVPEFYNTNEDSSVIVQRRNDGKKIIDWTKIFTSRNSTRINSVGEQYSVIEGYLVLDLIKVLKIMYIAKKDISKLMLTTAYTQDSTNFDAKSGLTFMIPEIMIMISKKKINNIPKFKGMADGFI